MKEVIEKLININKTISTMESCTGGCLSDEITNVEDSSKVFNFGAVTYSNEYKIKLGVNNETIDKYTVCSKEVSNEMSKSICNYTNSNYGVGITGRLDDSSIVYISIYDKDSDKYYCQTITSSNKDRKENKEIIIKIIIDMINNIIK
jgi:nicotinamide-nucleotide amidase